MKPFHLFGLLAFGVALAWQPGAAHSQEFLGKSLADWQQDLAPAKPAAARRSAAFALGKLDKLDKAALPTALGALLQTLQDSNAGVREAAAFSIGEICGKARTFSPEILKGLTNLLTNDKEPLVRRSAAFALGSIGRWQDDAVRNALAAKLKDEDPAVRQNVAWALGRMGDKAAPSLKQALKDKDTLVRRDAAGAISLIGEDAAATAIPELLACCAHNDVEERKAAYAALVRLVGPDDLKDAKEALLKGLKDGDVEIRRNAALGLAGIGGPEAAPAVPVLVDTLRVKNTEPNGLTLRRSAALAFGNIGPTAKDAIDDLRKALADPDETTRHNAAVSCIGLKDAAEPALPDLVKLLTDKNETDRVRAESAVAISRIGYKPGLKAVMPAILQLAADTTEKSAVRERALWPVRLYLNNDDNREPAYKALLSILGEPKAAQTKMLRYDSAYLLGMFQTAAVPDKALDVLEDFLKDPEIKIYAGRQGGSTGVTEKGGGTSESKETGKNDGRIMAVDALTRIGAQRVNQRPAIVAQLQRLNTEVNPKTDEDFAKKIKSLLKDLGK